MTTYAICKATNRSVIGVFSAQNKESALEACRVACGKSRVPLAWSAEPIEELHHPGAEDLYKAACRIRVGAVTDDA